MRIHDALRNKPFPAQPAYVGSLSRVRSFVNPQRRSLRKTLTAKLANERFLPRVHPFVLLQLFFPGEAFRARRASVRFIPGVNPPVELQLFFARQAFAADVAQNRRVLAGFVVLAQIVPF